MQPKRAISILNFPSILHCVSKKGLVAVYSFFISSFQFPTFIISIIWYIHPSPFAEASLRFIIACCAQGKTSPWGAEPIFDLGPALQQASALYQLTTACTIVEADNRENEQFTQYFTSEDLERHKYRDWLPRVTFSWPPPCYVPSLTLFFTCVS